MCTPYVVSKYVIIMCIGIQSVYPGNRAVCIEFSSQCKNPGCFVNRIIPHFPISLLRSLLQNAIEFQWKPCYTARPTHRNVENGLELAHHGRGHFQTIMYVLSVIVPLINLDPPSLTSCLHHKTIRACGCSTCI